MGFIARSAYSREVFEMDWSRESVGPCQKCHRRPGYLIEGFTQVLCGDCAYPWYKDRDVIVGIGIALAFIGALVVGVVVSLKCVS